jgi:hypothetical protein
MTACLRLHDVSVMLRAGAEGLYAVRRRKNSPPLRGYGATVKLKLKLPVRALPARSFAPVVTVTV